MNTPSLNSDMPVQAAKLIKILGIVFVHLMLAACVTETTGGFNVEVSDQKAMEDYIALARGYLDQGDLTSVKRHLSNAAKINNNNAEIYSIWGLVYAREGEADLADESFRRSLRIDSKNSQARNNYAAFLFSNGRYRDAYTQLELVVKDTEYSARPQAFENLGLAALRLNKPDDAEAAFVRAVQLNRNQLGSILELTSLSLVKKNTAQAGMYYRNYLTLQQFYKLEHTARSLWVGIQLELAQGNNDNLLSYGNHLAAGFSTSTEYQLYKQLLESRNDQ